MRLARFAAPVLGAALSLLPVLACAQETDPAAPSANPSPVAGGPRVHVVLFTHIEDNTPGGVLGSAQSRTAYLNLRARLLEMAALVRRYDVRWSLQPDWKFLEAARLYETAEVTATTSGLNLFRYLRDVQGVALDPHSHENGGYNYTDVAFLLETLGVGGSTVIGGHIWDPDLPQFQEWDRYRAPVRGEHYPAATWRGDILMGSGTPNHVNDPVVSGVWRPRDRADYFRDDPAGNIVSVGAFRSDLAGVTELFEMYRSGAVDAGCLLTSSQHVNPSTLIAPGGLGAVESGTVRPLAALRDAGQAALTDFTALVNTWRTEYGARGCLLNLTPGL